MKFELYQANYFQLFKKLLTLSWEFRPSLAFYFHLLLPYLESFCTLTGIIILIPALCYFGATATGVQYTELYWSAISKGVSCWAQDLPLFLAAAFWHRFVLESLSSNLLYMCAS